MMTKYEYRRYFAQCKKYVKLANIAENAGLQQSRLSQFMQGEKYDSYMSMFDCEIMHDEIVSTLKKLIV